MAYERRSFAGAAAATTLDGSIDGSTLTINIASSTGWPSGSAGDFFAVIDRGQATEEKVRVASRSSNTLTCTASGRGSDGTAAAAHTSGATVELCITAVDLDEANAHIADTALDHHTQYLDNDRHDIEARHTFGAALGTPAAAADIGTAASAGTGDNPAREDHVHQIGTGAIDTAAQFAAGVVDATALASDAVTNAKVAADAIDTPELVDAAVETAKLADGAVTAPKLATSIGRNFLVADAAALAALTGLREGDTAFQADINTMIVYDGAAWRGVTPTVVSTTTLSGTTSGTTELQIGSLSIPALPYPAIVLPSLQVNVVGTSAGDKYRLKVRDTNTSGTIRAQAQLAATAGGQGAPESTPPGNGFALAADTALTLVATLVRETGSSTITVSETASTINGFQALILPDLT